MKLLSGLTSPPSMAFPGVVSWISSLRACRVSHSLSPESRKDSRTSGPAESGRTFSESSQKCDPPWSSSKMSQACLSFFDPSERNYAQWGLKLRLEYSLRQRSVPRTGGNECLSSDGPRKEGSYWPTPDANPEAPNSSLNRGKNWGGSRRRLTVQGLGNRALQWPTPEVPNGGRGFRGTPEKIRSTLDGRKAQMGLHNAVEMWPSPRAEDSEFCGNHPNAVDSLTGAARLWQTPATDSFRSRGAERKQEMGLDQQARLWPTPQSKDFRSGEVSDRVWEGNSRPLNEAVCRLGPLVQPKANDGPRYSETGRNLRRLSGNRRLNVLFVQWLALGRDMIGWTCVCSNSPCRCSRIDQLRVLGNSVVPKTAELAFKKLTERILQ